MAAVASTSTYTGANRSTLPIPAPTGITTGDLLVIIAHTAGQGVAAASISTPTDFTLYDTNFVVGDGALAECGYKVFYKYAVLADESATTYTVTVGTEDGYSAEMFRITGAPTSGVPFIPGGKGTDGGSGSATFSVTGLTAYRPTQQVLLMTASAAVNNIPEVYSFGSYTITSSDANPTWTELIDTDDITNISTNACTGGAGTAYATSSNTSNITAFSLAATGDTNSSWAYGLYIIPTPQDATADISQIAVTPTVEGVTATEVLVVVDVSHLDTEPELTGIETKNSSDRTQWNNESQNSTTWTNTPK